ncbi:MAG: hypothetical protein GEU28_01515 [Dehalococcoidia bacterium]|nr:hypothetical protein [Dehalococcoidia bacterium]
MAHDGKRDSVPETVLGFVKLSRLAERQPYRVHAVAEQSKDGRQQGQRDWNRREDNSDRTNSKLLLHDSAYDAVHRFLRDAEWEVMVKVPMIYRGSGLGVLTAFYMTEYAPNREEVALLEAIADHAAVAAENARLFDESQGRAALEERQRLARELHDSVSQALYGIGLGARTARAILERDPVKAVEPIDYVISLAEAGLTEMRSLIFELRPESLEQEGLRVALEKQSDSLRARYGIAVEADLWP